MSKIKLRPLKVGRLFSKKPLSTPKGATPASPTTWRFTADKKGLAVWMSWVMLIGLSVTIGFFMLGWARDLFAGQKDSLIERDDYSSQCSSVGIRIEAACQNTQTLNINITNNDQVKIDGFVVRIVDIYGGLQLRESNTSLKPQDTTQLSIVKQGIAQKADIMPAVKSGNKRITCQNRILSIERINIC